MVPMFIKVLVTLLVILAAAGLGRKWPSLAGLIATMPLTALLVMIWLYLDNKADTQLLRNYCQGVIWGIFPSLFFFVAAYGCFLRGYSLIPTLVISYIVWAAGALLHRWLVP